MDGSNLESFYGQASKDIAEMIKYYPKDRDINIVCESGGVEGGDTSELEGEGNTRFTIDDTGISNCNKIEARNMGEKDTFELVGFDACLMSNIETANVVNDYSKYMIASEDLEPEDGWNYEWLSSLKSESNGEEIGKEIGNRYEEFYKDKDIS